MLKTSQKFQKNAGFVLTVLVVMILIVSCSQKKPTQTEMMPPPVVENEPTVIELADSKVNDLLNEGDIPEEDRGDLPWLPKRPPLGMRFKEIAALQTVYFEFDKYSLTRQTREALDANAAWIRNNAEVFVQIEGHCDERGTDDYNEVLGENRAIAVKKYLVSLGIEPDRLYTISYGESMPADLGHTEDAWAKNRRAVFKVSQ